MIRNIGASSIGKHLNGAERGKVGKDKTGSQADKISRLKREIENGDYTLDLKKTAIKIVQELKPEESP